VAWVGGAGVTSVRRQTHGRLTEQTLHSASLGVDRKLTVYLPPNVVDRSWIPIIFMADGNDCEEYAKVVEPLIVAKQIKPMVIVGMHAAEYGGDLSKPYNEALDFRGKEYLPGFDDMRFKKHMEFLTKEVLAWAIKELGISPDRKGHIVFGFSDGGAFAAAAAEEIIAGAQKVH
jgi:enterochelin esterase-like enzyme